MIPLDPLIVAEIYGVQGTDFMGPFLIYFRNKYILIVVDYVSKWVVATH